jgi:hypothetical protein
MTEFFLRRKLKPILLGSVAFVFIWSVDGLSAARPSRSETPQTQAQRIDEEYTKRILDNTPDKRILTELVDHMPLSETVPSPLKFLGYVPGEDNRLTYHKDIVAYYEALDKASDRVAMWEIGKTEEGRPMVALAVSEPRSGRSMRTSGSRRNLRIRAG